MSQQSLIDVLDSFDKVIETHIEGKLLEVGQKDTERDAQRTRFKRAGGKDELVQPSQAGPDERAAAEKVLGSKAALRASVADFNTAADQKIAVIGAHGKALAAAATELERPKYRALNDLSIDPDWEKRVAEYPPSVAAYIKETLAQAEREMAKPHLSYSAGVGDGGLAGVVGTAMRDRVGRMGYYWTSALKALRREFGCPIAHKFAVWKLSRLKERMRTIEYGGKKYIVWNNDAVSDTTSIFNDKEDALAMESVSEDMVILHVDRDEYPQDIPLLDWWMAWCDQFEELWERHGVGGPSELTARRKAEGWFVGAPIDRVTHPFQATMRYCGNRHILTGKEKYLKSRDWMAGLSSRNFHTKPIKAGHRHPTAPFVFSTDQKVSYWGYDISEWSQLLFAEPLNKIAKTTVYAAPHIPQRFHMFVYAALVLQYSFDSYCDGYPGYTKELCEEQAATMLYSFLMGAPHDWRALKDGKWIEGKGFTWKGVEGVESQVWDEKVGDKNLRFKADDGQTFLPAHYEGGGFFRREGQVEQFPTAVSIVFAPNSRTATYLESIDTSGFNNEIYQALSIAFAHDGR